MSKGFWEQFEEDCATLGPGIGAATGAAYGFGADKIGLGKLGEVTIEATIGGFVADNWQHSCSLPSIIAEAIGPQQQSPAIDSSAPAPDTSISISD